MKSVSEGGSSTRDVLACLAVPSRYRLVMAIANADLCVGELAVSVGLSQSCTTRHLQALERAGLVRGTRDGRRVRFVLCTEADGARSILDLVLGETGSPPAAAAVKLRTAGRRWPQARSAGVRPAKSLSKVTFVAVQRGAADGRDQRGDAPDRPSNEEPGSDSQVPVRPFRRQDIEDYLL